jgi:hypothetical protein
MIGLEPLLVRLALIKKTTLDFGLALISWRACFHFISYYTFFFFFK